MEVSWSSGSQSRIRIEANAESPSTSRLAKVAQDIETFRGNVSFESQSTSNACFPEEYFYITMCVVGLEYPIHLREKGKGQPEPVGRTHEVQTTDRRCGTSPYLNPSVFAHHPSSSQALSCPCPRISDHTGGDTCLRTRKEKPTLKASLIRPSPLFYIVFSPVLFFFFV